MIRNNAALRRRDALGNRAHDARKFRRREMDAHARTAEQQSAFKLALAHRAPDAEADLLKRNLILFFRHADVRYFKPQLLQMGLHCFFSSKPAMSAPMITRFDFMVILRFQIIPLDQYPSAGSYIGPV